jgi:hypothetical protein
MSCRMARSCQVSQPQSAELGWCKSAGSRSRKCATPCGGCQSQAGILANNLGPTNATFSWWHQASVLISPLPECLHELRCQSHPPILHRRVCGWVPTRLLCGRCLRVQAVPEKVDMASRQTAEHPDHAWGGIGLLSDRTSSFRP